MKPARKINYSEHAMPQHEGHTLRADTRQGINDRSGLLPSTRDAYGGFAGVAKPVPRAKTARLSRQIRLLYDTTCTYSYSKKKKLLWASFRLPANHADFVGAISVVSRVVRAHASFDLSRESPSLCCLALVPDVPGSFSDSDVSLGTSGIRTRFEHLGDK